MFQPELVNQNAQHHQGDEHVDRANVAVQALEQLGALACDQPHQNQSGKGDHYYQVLMGCAGDFGSRDGSGDIGGASCR
ncbi:hypothetical protein D9M68_823400 [compost metagenome]